MSRPWMPLYVADYLRDTRKLTAAEHGAYLLLIMEYWTAGGLPDDDRQLARIASMSAAEWKRARPNIEGFFHDEWKHKRLDAELARSAEISSKRAASAKQRHSNSSANAEQMDTHARASSQPQSQSQEESSLRSDSARKRGTRLPEGWSPTPEGWQAACDKLGQIEARNELAKFRDHWIAQPGQRGVKLDWDATWRNWIRNARGSNGYGNSTIRTNSTAGPAATRDVAVLAGMGRALERRRAARAADDAGREELREAGCAGAAGEPDADRSAATGDAEPSAQLAFLPARHAGA